MTTKSPISSVAAILDDVLKAEGFGEVRNELARVINLPEPVTPEVAARFLADTTFAKTIIGVRNQPEWRDRMLQDPLNIQFAIPFEKGDLDQRNTKTITELALKSANAYISWSTEGFKQVDEETLQHRRDACLTCDQLQEAPNTLAYSLASVVSDGDKRICAACGCLFKKKTIMPEERCPLPMLNNSNKSRWNDPI